jgi:hypothetical protein
LECFFQKNELEFLGLKEGNYNLLVKAKKGEFVTSIQKFSFTVKSPWYRSIWAYIFYLVLISGVFQFLRQIHEKRLRNQRKEMLEKQKNLLTSKPKNTDKRCY